MGAEMAATIAANEEQRQIPKTNSQILATIKANLKFKAIKIPIAHGEGKYYADADTLKSINDNDQVLFRYCDEDGNINSENNPNGSVENIAGVTNKQRTVFGMMPHPERAADDELGNTDGRLFFESMIKEIEGNLV